MDVNTHSGLSATLLLMGARVDEQIINDVTWRTHTLGATQVYIPKHGDPNARTAVRISDATGLYRFYHPKQVLQRVIAIQEVAHDQR